jgi:hypothetical protein
MKSGGERVLFWCDEFAQAIVDDVARAAPRGCCAVYRELAGDDHDIREVRANEFVRVSAEDLARCNSP